MAHHTKLLFRTDSYARTLKAEVLGVNDLGGILLDRTIFYAASGGQPGDTGVLALPCGQQTHIAMTIHPDGNKDLIVHVPLADQPAPKVGDMVICTLDWARRHKLMRMHSALHLLSVVFPFSVTGGAISAVKGRLDFDMPEIPEDIAGLTQRLNDYVRADHPITQEWITEAQLDANPDMVKTMNVKPPRGQGRIRLIRIGAGPDSVDLQPCGGTHVLSTAEIGPLRIGKIEKKGRENRRVNLFFAEDISL